MEDVVSQEDERQERPRGQRSRWCQGCCLASPMVILALFAPDECPQVHPVQKILLLQLPRLGQTKAKASALGVVEARVKAMLNLGPKPKPK